MLRVKVTTKVQEQLFHSITDDSWSTKREKEREFGDATCKLCGPSVDAAVHLVFLLLEKGSSSNYWSIKWLHQLSPCLYFALPLTFYSFSLSLFSILFPLCNLHRAKFTEAFFLPFPFFALFHSFCWNFKYAGSNQDHLFASICLRWIKNTTQKQF